MLKKTVTIINKLGLHARASAKLVAHCSRYASEIELIRGDKRVHGKSIMGVMTLGASKGTQLELIVDGEDEERAMGDIATLIAERFGEAE